MIWNCWTLNNRIIWWSGFRCDTPGSSWKPLLSSYIAGWPCFFTLAVPNQFRYPARGQDPVSLMHTDRRLLTEAYYYVVGTSGYTVKCHITSVVLWLDCSQTSLIFLYRIIHKSLQDVRPLRYSSRDGHAEGEHVNRGRDTASFCPTLQVLDMSFLLCLSWLLHSRVWKFRRDLWITLYISLRICNPSGMCLWGFSISV
jgi:hypothetical protein